MKTRLEHDLLGEKEVPADAYYGIQTLRGIENFANISGIEIGNYPHYVKALAMVKWAASRRTKNWAYCRTILPQLSKKLVKKL